MKNQRILSKHMYLGICHNPMQTGFTCRNVWLSIQNTLTLQVVIHLARGDEGSKQQHEGNNPL